MAQEKEERPSAAARKTGEAGDDSIRRTTGAHRTASRDSGNNGLTAAPPGRRRERYVIGIRTAAGSQPFARLQHSMDEVVQYLGHQENVEIVKRIKLGGTQPFMAEGSSVNEVVVAKIDESKAQRLRSVAPPHLIIERDSLLSCADYLPLPSRVMSIGTLLPLRSVATEVTIRVVGERDQPLARATVVVDGGELPVQALTDETGTARVTFFGGSIETVRTLFIRATANHWDRVIPAPRLSAGINTVKLRPLSELYPNFPSGRLLGWGQRLMGMGTDPIGGRSSGSGVRIGLIDSGCDNTHPLLRHVTQGKDFIAGGTDTSWSQDVVSHGTHCAGIINAAATEQGIIGCAPAAELHVFKVIPEGRISDLLAALDECIERELDIINISVVSDGFSELVSQKLQEARQKGIACIVAAGNSGGPLLFPATLPGVLTIAAVGKLREFPADSSHVLSVIPQLIGGDDIFAASFSGTGPQVAFSAPGVAIVSTVAGGGYAATDGTSAAAAHVTGLAALVLAHHPVFQEGSFGMRSEQRVHALVELIRQSAVPRFLDTQRGGAGVPDLGRIPAQTFMMGGSDSAERAALPGYWPPSSVQGWPTWLPARADSPGLF